MNCEIVSDLIPLYIDGCCSEASALAVEEHIQTCDHCKRLLEGMRSPVESITKTDIPPRFHRLDQWKASVLQSVLLFLSFAVITVGVTLEARTPLGAGNGFWAMYLIIPATGFLLSLANWYFVRLYRTGKQFSNASSIATLVITLCAYAWAGFHYAMNPLNIFTVLLTILCCVLSKVLSSRYANMLGKM